MHAHQVHAHRHELGLVIDQSILAMLGIDRETELQLTVDGTRLIVEPVRPRRKAELRAVAQRSLDAHAETLRKLGD